MKNGEALNTANSQNKRNIYLTGFMGSGKTTVGKYLSQRLEKTFIDLDLEIEQNAGLTIPEILEKHGEEYFRNLEKENLANVSQLKNAIIALGGGTLISKDNQEQIREGLLVYLMADEKTLMKRLENSHSRPLLQKNDFSTLLDTRKEGYMNAHFFVKTDDVAPEELSERIAYGISGL